MKGDGGKWRTRTHHFLALPPFFDVFFDRAKMARYFKAQRGTIWHDTSVNRTIIIYHRAN